MSTGYVTLCSWRNILPGMTNWVTWVGNVCPVFFYKNLSGNLTRHVDNLYFVGVKKQKQNLDKDVPASCNFFGIKVKWWLLLSLTHLDCKIVLRTRGSASAVFLTLSIKLEYLLIPFSTSASVKLIGGWTCDLLYFKWTLYHWPTEAAI